MTGKILKVLFGVVRDFERKGLNLHTTCIIIKRRKKMKTKTIILLAIFVYITAPGCEKKEQIALKGDPKAQALYEKMIQTMRNAQTIYYESIYECEELEGETIPKSNYKIWMKKPNYALIELEQERELKGVIIGDGTYCWLYWPNERPCFPWEDSTEHVKTCSTSYMKELGLYSIAHLIGRLRINMGLPILQPSVFHNRPDHLVKYIDSVVYLGTEKIDVQEYDVIEVSYMNHQRSKYYWLSKVDHLPRKLKQVIRTAETYVSHELWSDVAIDMEIPDEKFTWQPPKHWQEYGFPQKRDGLLNPGTEAPDFACKGVEGSTIKLSDYRGKIIIINFWRVGCPPCRKDIPYLEELYRKYKDNGLVVIGFNCDDDMNITRDLLKEHSVTYPNIVDASDEAKDVCYKQYQTMRGKSAVPLHYLIDKERKVVDAWYGFGGEELLHQALLKAGLK